ncbi:50S ribosomal protein L11 methyltransferase [Campylobacter sp. MIT 99-7217]|uniref:50S ribosomal protein L11 methyltransferase n=1 Tax=Campylobacter sp. MIT 99-7217 TaxID=535091 RepID=UPI001156D201|nr:50S ribosomal protein L11 methyltransferase [Campylobacter sp. MIT 99-7217]TQR33787.1 50S ribosomal protein L11 methyltransferase [Campylobacter sp. MIT 99-7217]
MLDSYNELCLKVDKKYTSVFIDFVFEFGVEAVEEENENIYIRSTENLNELAWAVDLFKDKLKETFNEDFYFDTSLTQKQNKDWIEEYKKNVQPIKINDIYIHSSWQKPEKNLINVQIDPALAFGSGHHESTNSCIELLQEFAKKDMKALDIGCGSGILSIVLAKLGCKTEACDTDELAIQSTLANAKLNKVFLDKIWQGSISKNYDKYDLVIANLIADVILNLKDELKSTLKINSFLILSGILDKYEQRVQEAFKDLNLIKVLRQNEWLSLVYRKEK